MNLFSPNTENKTSTMLEVGQSRGLCVCVLVLGAKHNQPNCWPGCQGGWLSVIWDRLHSRMAD